ncbi:telomerase protein component 1-like [Carcharodon carcharias]|uniref:telomerase protein component 1-like n=1 Tax=Carcharodon carcharias TaxID=13397 RepID=UPI001B7E7858|nr:telomerase protein component 1-like [Carcharodon carcharias]
MATNGGDIKTGDEEHLLQSDTGPPVPLGGSLRRPGPSAGRSGDERKETWPASEGAGERPQAIYGAVDPGPEEPSVADEDTLQEAFLEEQSGQRHGRSRQLAAAVAAVRERRGGAALVVHGRPGEGKTTFMASLVTQLALGDQERRSGPTDLLFHFTAASETSQDGASMLQRLCILLDDRLKGQQEIPRSYRGLVLMFQSLLERFAHSQPRGYLVLVIDGADCVRTGNDQRTSDWIPEKVPDRVSLVLSVTEDSPLLRTLAKHRGTVTIRLGPLEPLDRSEIVRRRLAVYGKKLEESAFNNQMRQLVMKKESHNPLFLKLATEELREFGVFEKVSDQIRALPATLRLLIQHVLGCLEEEHGAETVTLALSALSANEKGLRERVLYSILCTRRGLRTGTPALTWEEVMQEALKPSRPVPMATFIRLMRSLRCIMGVWAPAETPNSRLRLSNTLLRAAVQQRYLRNKNEEKQLHLFLAVHLWRLTDPDENGTFTHCDPETLGDLPQHLILAGEISRLGSLLTNLYFSSLHVRLGMLAQLITAFNLYHAAASGAAGSGGPLPEVGPYRDFVAAVASLPALSREPALFWQQALNQPDASPVCRQAHAVQPLPPRREAPGSFRLVEWTNKPQASGGTEGKCVTALPESVELKLKLRIRYENVTCATGQ